MTPATELIISMTGLFFAGITGAVIGTALGILIGYNIRKIVVIISELKG